MNALLYACEGSPYNNKEVPAYTISRKINVGRYVIHGSTPKQHLGSESYSYTGEAGGAVTAAQNRLSLQTQIWE